MVGLMLLGPQRVRIADTSALMLESIERTAAVLERAGRGVQANHTATETSLISWQQHAGSGGGGQSDAMAVEIEAEGQLGEVYRLV